MTTLHFPPPTPPSAGHTFGMICLCLLLMVLLAGSCKGPTHKETPSTEIKK
jgi:hypothetical protein